MKKIILAATGDELTWVPWYLNGFRLCRENPPAHHRGAAFFFGDEYAYVFDTDDLECTLKFMGDLPSKDAVEQKAVELGIIRIEETAEPQLEPGRTTQDYLLDEAEAIIKDVVCSASGRACLDSARTLAFIVDLQNYRSGK